MQVSVDLGLSTLLVLVACLVFPLFGFAIQRKWQRDAARKEELRRLLLLASEEDARAELEATASYGVVSVSRSYYQCAVCYCPTTTRCARCKSIRYCSGKCQIIHWRQGHKNECRPPTSHQNDDAGTGSSEKADGQDQKYDILSERPVVSNYSSSSDNKRGSDDTPKADLSLDNGGLSPASETTSSEFSGFSSSATNTDVSDDVSVSEITTSNDKERSDAQASVNVSPDVLETACLDNNDQIKPLSPKFASLVNCAHGFSNLSKSHITESGCNDGEKTCSSAPCSSTGLSTGDMKEGLTSQPLRGSDFWDRALKSTESRDDALNNVEVSSSDGTGDSNPSDAASSLCFSFSLPKTTTVFPSCSEESEQEHCVLGNTPRTKLQPFLPKSVHTDASNVVKGQSLKPTGSKYMNNGTGSNVPAVNSREVKSSTCTSLSSGIKENSISTNAFNISRFPSSTSGCVDHVSKDAVSFHILESRQLEHTSSTAPEFCGPSTLGGRAVQNATSQKVDGVQIGPNTSSEAASLLKSTKNGLRTSVLKVVDQFRGSRLPKHDAVVAGNETTGKYNDKGLFAYELFVKLYNWNKVALHPCGLINCGNSCYANSVLQCLAFTPPLTAYFLQGLHSKACLNKNWCFTCEFERLILKAKVGTSPLSPAGVLSQLQNIGSHLGNGREEDAHEFLRYAIETMQSVYLKEAKVSAPSSVEEETTLIGLTFGGYLRSKIKCTKCQGRSERQEKMMDLTVEIDGDIGTLEDALRRFTGTEILDGENKYHCSRCKSYEKGKKKLTVLEAPNILTIALKRFQAGKFGKLNKPIRFPEILNLAPYMSGTSDRLPIYRLYAVIVHLDIMNAAFSGHYVCYVKNIQNRWFKIDDSTVTAVDLDNVLAQGAYMLLYARCSPRAPRLIRNSIVPPDAKAKLIPSKSCCKKLSSKSGGASKHPSVLHAQSNSSILDHSGGFDFYSELLQRTMDDSSSDNSSLISSNSDECSCSTDSTHDSMSTDDLSDYIFGDPGCQWRVSSDSNTSTLADMDCYASGYPGTSRALSNYSDLPLEGDCIANCRSKSSSKQANSKDRKDVNFFHSDSGRNDSNLPNISGREADQRQTLGSINRADGRISVISCRNLRLVD